MLDLASARLGSEASQSESAFGPGLLIGCCTKAEVNTICFGFSPLNFWKGSCHYWKYMMFCSFFSSGSRKKMEGLKLDLNRLDFARLISNICKTSGLNMFQEVCKFLNIRFGYPQQT